VEAYGTLDELNAVLGAVRAFSTQRRLQEILTSLQKELFLLGAELASPDGGSPGRAASLSAEQVEKLEAVIDELTAQLPPLDRFILLGGSPAGALLHLARTVARRAERRVVALAAVSEVRPVVLQYLNRLSDLLFVLARWLNAAEGQSETRWLPDPGGRAGTAE